MPNQIPPNRSEKTALGWASPAGLGVNAEQRGCPMRGPEEHANVKRGLAAVESLA
jgi:hypothetical protein